jgi:hypothetical protein
MRSLAALFAALIVSSAVCAQEAPPATRTLELHIHALSRGYMRPMRATTERIAAVEGLADTVALGFGGDVLRYRVTTPLGDDAIAAALGLQKMGLVGNKLLLAADPKSPRAMRAEARLVILEIARMINLRPKPQWRSAHKPIFEGADTTQK